ncbi:MAG: glycosyltransferase family 2 protein [Parcubacteria group bacterium]|nr:glycosyltransferase family 2 protein [Parcubacteria group bacterium]
MSTEPQYSIIIPTYNRAKTLALTLNSVCNQTISAEKYEIIVVDDDSTDETELRIKNYELIIKKPEIRYFKIKNGGPAKARNFGIIQSKGEIIFFTNDDYIVPKNWMETILDGYKRYPEVGGVGGWHETISNEAGFWQRCVDTMDNKFGGGILDAEIKTNLYFSPYIGAQSANLSYKKSILQECGGFDENLRSSRWPLKVKIIKKSRLKDFFYKHIGEGKDLFYLHKKYPKLINDIYGNLLNNFLGLLAYAGASRFYTAYFFSVLCRIGGRIFAKYLERPVIEGVDLLPNETFEISKKLSGEEKFIKTSGRLFSKSIFRIKESETDFCSVVIPTYNRAESLIKALENLINQTISPEKYEIIIIDDGSTDDTELRIRNYELRIRKPEIKYFKIENGGPAKARNFGIEKAWGELVFFTDDDCTVPPDWMETLLSGFKKYPEAAGAGGWIVPPDGELEKSAISRFLHFESFSGHPIVKSYIRSHEILSNDPLMCFGNFAYNTANICYKKEVLKAIGGFREDFYWPGSEDNDLAFRIAQAGHYLLYLPFHVTHPKAMTLSEFVKLHFHRGANGYLLRIIHQKLLEKLKPGFVRDYGSMASFVFRFSGPEKFLALVQWLSINAGIRYMKRALKRNPISSEPIAEVADNCEKRKSNYV